MVKKLEQIEAQAANGMLRTSSRACKAGVSGTRQNTEGLDEQTTETRPVLETRVEHPELRLS